MLPAVRFQPQFDLSFQWQDVGCLTGMASVAREVGILFHFIGSLQACVCVCVTTVASWGEARNAFYSLFPWGQWLTRETGLGIKEEVSYISLKPPPQPTDVIYTQT